MAVFLNQLFLVFLLVEHGLCQCFKNTGCRGATVPSDDQRDCCVHRSGLSFSNAGTCRACKGTSYNTPYNKRKCCVLAVHGFRQAVYNVSEDDAIITEFALNVVGTTQSPALVVSGTVSAEADGTAGKHHLLKPVLHPYLSLITGVSDFESLQDFSVINSNVDPSTEVLLFTVNDEVTLEYEDRVLLSFTPAQANLTESLAASFEYIRDTAIINIIDNDRKWLCIDFLPLLA